MSDIFISHVEENADVAARLAVGLEQAGYRTWTYERDALPGVSYLLQTAHAIEDARAVVLLISPDSLGSHQVTSEVVRAHESGKPFIPVLIRISHVEFAARQPEWREALGSATSVALPDGRVEEILPRVLDGLRGLGIVPVAVAAAPAAPPVVAAPAAPAPPPPQAPTAPAATPTVTAAPPVAVPPAPAVAYAPYAAPPPSMSRPAPPRPPQRQRPMILGIVGGVIALVVIVGLVFGGAAKREAVQTAGTSTSAASSSTTRSSRSSSTTSTTRGTTSTTTRPAQSFPSADTTPLTTSAGTMQVTDASFSQQVCPPAGIPGDCLTATGSDQYLVLHMAPAGGGSAALSQVFTDQAFQSTLTFGDGQRAGAYSVFLDQTLNRVEIVYGIVPGSATADDILLTWPGNDSVVLTTS